MSVILKCVSILLLLTSVIAKFDQNEYFEREDGDSLIFMQTKVSVPTIEKGCHILRYEWSSTEVWYTNVKIELNGWSLYDIGYPNRTYFNIKAEDFDTRQLIVTVAAYGFNISDVPPPVDGEIESRQSFSKDNNIDTCIEFNKP